MCSANKDNISNCLPPLNPLIIGLSGNQGVYSRRFTCRSGSVVRPTDPACLLAHLPEIGWLRWWLSVGFIAGNKKVPGQLNSEPSGRCCTFSGADRHRGKELLRCHAEENVNLIVFSDFDPFDQRGDDIIDAFFAHSR